MSGKCRHISARPIFSAAATRVNADRLIVTAELSEARNNQVVWTDRLSGEIGDLLQPESELAGRIAQAVHVSVFDAEVEHILTQPLPTLEELLAAAWQHQADAPLQQG